MELQMVAQALTNAGYIARIEQRQYTGTVTVRLNARTVSKMEVQTVLWQEFDGVDFKLSRESNVIVIEL